MVLSYFCKKKFNNAVMIKSMTGFGKARYENGDKKISIEIKSLNSKQLDLSIKMPSLYKEKEIEIRNLISELLIRGKIDISFFNEFKSAENVPAINKLIVKEYFKQLKEINSELNIKELDDPLATILRLPDTLKTEKEELDEMEWEGIKASVMDAINDLNKFREQEGETLHLDIINRVNSIIKLNDDIKAFENKRIEDIKNRISGNLNEFITEEQIDKNRFEQEIIYYLEKIDMTEEKVRLQNHCNYFLKTMDDAHPVGKKLGFIAQEMGREINTIGSKANNADIQKIVVEMKDELEKIKEQLMNVL